MGEKELLPPVLWYLLPTTISPLFSSSPPTPAPFHAQVGDGGDQRPKRRVRSLPAPLVPLPSGPPSHTQKGETSSPFPCLPPLFSLEFCVSLFFFSGAHHDSNSFLFFPPPEKKRRGRKKNKGEEKRSGRRRYKKEREEEEEEEEESVIKTREGQKKMREEGGARRTA